MDVDETVGLLAYIHELYDSFPMPNHAMTKLWCESLQHIEDETAHAAILRWARQHNFKAPSLDELLEQIEFIRDDQRLANRHGSSTKSFLDVMKDAAEAQADNPMRSEMDGLYGRLMALLAERSISTWYDKQGVSHPKLTLEQRGEQCYAWANAYETKHPRLADDLRAAARQFAALLYTEQSTAA